MKQKLKKILIRLFAVLSSAVVGIVISEVFLSLLPINISNSGNNAWYQYDETLGVRLRPNLDETTMAPDYQQEMMTNTLGTVNSWSNFDGYGQTIFAIGDSFTQGTGLYIDASYPSQLDIILNLKNGNFYKNFAVVNLGLSSYGLRQSMLAAEEYIKRINKPDIVLFLGYTNDYDDDRLFSLGYRHRHIVQGSPYFNSSIVKINTWLSNNSKVFVLAKTTISYFRRKRFLQGDSIARASQPSAKLSELDYHALKIFADTIGARLILSFAHNFDNDDGSYDWLKKWSEQNEIEFVDWLPHVNSYSENRPRLTIGNPHSGGHYRTWVNTIIAREFAKTILQKKDIRTYIY